MRLKLKTMFALCAVGAMLSGCGHSNPVPSKPKPMLHKNGTIASMKKVTVQGQNLNINIYDMYYWSENEKVEAYVTEPKNAEGNEYPLMVNLHGGWATPKDTTHYLSPATLQATANSSPNVVTITPQYRGYSNSQGTVQGILGDTVDTENAIQAADSLKVVDPSVLNVVGTSMGGGVALMLDANPAYANTLRSVVAVSPFVGWETIDSYAKQHPDDTNDNQWMVDGESYYGPFSPTSPAYIKRSPDISKMAAPALLLQGTADTSVTWQTVQMFANEMKAQNKTLKLVLVPGGDHGLQNHPQVATKEIKQWFKQYQ